MNTALTGMDCHALASAVLAWLGQALLSGTMLALLTWFLVRLMGRRISPSVEALLWSIVLVKFLIPAGPAWSFSMAGIYERLPFPVDSREGTVPYDSLSAPAAPSEGSLAVAAEAPSEAASDIAAAVTDGHGSQPRDGSKTWHGTTTRHASTLAAMAYLACAAGLLLRRGWFHLVLRARCRALPPAGRAVQQLATEVCRRLGVRRIPSLRISGEGAAPFVTGHFRPILVLNHHQLLRPDELETVILHEVAHLRRGDMIGRYLQWIAGSLLFFWPVVAWVNRRIDLAREAACDEWALCQGKLAAWAYARCLLNAMEPIPSGPLACRSTGLVTNPRSMERRIDMILDYPDRSSNRRGWGLLMTVLLLCWGGFALTGGVEASPEAVSSEAVSPEAALPEAFPQGAVSPAREWPVTEKGVKERAAQLYNRVAEIPAADINGDGGLTYLEKDAYLVSLAMQVPEAFMEEYPFSDRNHNEKLDCLEVYGVIRGITLIAYADRRPNAASQVRLDLEFYHLALDAQVWLLDHRTSEPGEATLDNHWSVMKRIQGSGKADHHRKLDHGAPEGLTCKTGKGSLLALPRFQELEGKIRALKKRLDVEDDPREAAKIRVMLDKLEGILFKLRNS